MNLLFLDLETLDTAPTAIVDEFAAIVFTLPTEPGSQPEIIVSMDSHLCIPTQLIAGRTWSPDTLRHRFGNHTIPTHFTGTKPEQTLRDFLSLIEAYQIAELWIWGKDFDRPILDSLLAQAGLRLPPYFYRQTRCARDEFDGAFGGTGRQPRKKTHVALEDCRASILDLHDALQARPRSYPAPTEATTVAAGVPPHTCPTAAGAN